MITSRKKVDFSKPLGFFERLSLAKDINKLAERYEQQEEALKKLRTQYNDVSQKRDKAEEKFKDYERKNKTYEKTIKQEKIDIDSLKLQIGKAKRDLAEHYDKEKSRIQDLYAQEEQNLQELREKMEIERDVLEERIRNLFSVGQELGINLVRYQRKLEKLGYDPVNLEYSNTINMRNALAKQKRKNIAYAALVAVAVAGIGAGILFFTKGCEQEKPFEQPASLENLADGYKQE
jgi:chromosome segregation ATPase